MNIVTVGIDLAKNVFDLHGVDQSGKAVLIKPKVVRGQLLEMVAHYWAREFSRFGTVWPASLSAWMADCASAWQRLSVKGWAMTTRHFMAAVKEPKGAESFGFSNKCL